MLRKFEQRVGVVDMILPEQKVTPNITSDAFFSPIVLSVYDRLEHLKKCIESLVNCQDADRSVLHIYSDAPGKNEHTGRIEDVRSFIGTITGFRAVVPHFWPTNMGAHGSISSGFKEVFSDNDRLIFLEDDIVVSPHFLRYMNEGLEHYCADPDILAVCAYTLPFKMPSWYRKDVFLGRRYSPWGVGLWKRKWEEIDFSWRNRYQELLDEKKLMSRSKAVGGDYVLLVEADSQKRMEAMDVRVCHHQISRDQFCVFPKISLSTNSGFDGSGMHCSETQRFDAVLDMRSSYSIRFPSRLRESRVIRARFRDFQDGKGGIGERIIRKACRAFQLITKRDGPQPRRGS